MITNGQTGSFECASGRALVKGLKRTKKHKELARRSFYFCLRFWRARACVCFVSSSTEWTCTKASAMWRDWAKERPARFKRPVHVAIDEWPKKFQPAGCLPICFSSLIKQAQNGDRNWKFLLRPLSARCHRSESWKFVKLISLKFIQSVEGLSFHVVKRRPLKYLRFAARHSRGGAPSKWIRAQQTHRDSRHVPHTRNGDGNSFNVSRATMRPQPLYLPEDTPSANKL